jgi:hypothetical protein
MILFDLSLNESMLILDGGLLSDLPEGSGGPLLAGPEAIFIGTRIDVDAPTRLMVVTAVPDSLGPLVEGFAGNLASPVQVLRVANVFGDEYITIPVSISLTGVQILLSNFEEPDLVVIVVGSACHAE